MRRALAGVLTAIVALLTMPGSAASADDPIDLNQQITDTAEVLGDRQPAVQEALDRFFDRTSYRLYVVYVPTFGEMGANEWAEQTAKMSGVGRSGVLLAFSVKDRAFGHATTNPKLTPRNLAMVDRTEIGPALRNDDYAKATIDAADAYAALAEEKPLPWAWIVSGIGIVLVAVWILLRRSRRRFEHTHHVLDQHGNPVDPANILTLEEIDVTSAAALVAVDDALLTSAHDVAAAATQLGEDAVARFAAVVEDGRAVLDEAFRRRLKLDKLIAKGRSDEETERKWRKRASRILARCEQVDAALDAEIAEFDQARDLKQSARELLDGLDPQVEHAAGRLPGAREVYAQLPTRAAASVAGNVELADGLIQAATKQLAKRKQSPATRVRAIEDALATANDLLDAVGDADARLQRPSVEWSVAATERFIDSRRGAIGARARTLRAAARRNLDAVTSTADADAAAAALDRAARFAEQGLRAATEDVAAWQRARDTNRDPHSITFDALVLAGILVDETDSGGLRTLLGGSSHGGGSGAPYRGIEHSGTLRTVGSFGGTTTRGRRGGF